MKISVDMSYEASKYIPHYYQIDGEWYKQNTETGKAVKI